METYLIQMVCSKCGNVWINDQIRLFLDFLHSFLEDGLRSLKDVVLYFCTALNYITKFIRKNKSQTALHAKSSPDQFHIQVSLILRLNLRAIFVAILGLIFAMTNLICYIKL